MDSGCENVFIARVHNQIYCCSECTRIQTNANIMERYYDKKLQKAGKTRICSECNFTKLSMWNDTKICAACEKKPRKKRSVEVKNTIAEMI